MDFSQIFTGGMVEILSSMNNSNLLDRTLYEQSPIKNVISEKGKEQLKNIKYYPQCCSNSTCPIFHVDFEDDDEITVLPCKHGFTTEAINKWISDEKAECPVCRFKLDSVEKRVNNSQNDNDYDNDTRENIHNFFNQNHVPQYSHYNTRNVIYSHPFGPSIERIATIVSEEDDHNDLMRAFNTVHNNNAYDRIRTIFNSRAFRIWQNSLSDVSANLYDPSLD